MFVRSTMMVVREKKNIRCADILCVFGLITAALVQSAPTSHEGNPVVQGTLLEIAGPFYVIMGSPGKDQRIHVDKSTMIIGDVQHGPTVKAEATKEVRASAIK